MKSYVFASLMGIATVRYFFPALPVSAQIVPDNTLGPDRSIVVPNQTIRGIDSDRIDGGAIRGNNLFHSFQEFNIDAGRGAFFANPDSIANILSRVTGENISNIFGTLGVLGNANLFLVNPNGIVFGPNARLDVSGSFFATTNNGFIFENGFEFVASNSDAPPLLTINIPIGLRLRENPGVIENQSIVRDSQTGDIAGLQVSFGQTLGLVGGEIIINNGALTAPGGRLELAGVSGLGTIQLDTEENNINGLQISSPVNREDIILTNGAFLDVVSSRGGDITIDGRNIDISNFSRLFAGIAPGEGTPDTQGGDIEINASEDFQLLNNSIIANQIFPNSQGNTGDIRITANHVFLNGFATLSSSSLGQGNAGNVIITANDRTSLDGGSFVFSIIENGGEGLGGNIRIMTKDLFLSGGTTLQALTRGVGDAGNVDITASGSVSLDGSNFTGFPTAIYSSVEPGGEGNGGNINISTGSLSVSNDADLQTLVRGSVDGVLPPGQGNAGTININATGRVSFDGAGSGVFSGLELGTTGSGGNVLINAGSVFVTNGAELSASTDGFGDAGKVTINAENLVSFDSGGSASSNIEINGRGNSNGVEINTGSLRVTNGSVLSASVIFTTFDDEGVFAGEGNAGDIQINARDSVVLTGVDAQGNASSAFSTLGRGAVGSGGNIRINTGNLSVTNSAILSTSTGGMGNAGQIVINANDTVTFNNSSTAFSTVEAGAKGDSGGIEINTGSLEVSNGSALRAVVRSQGGSQLSEGTAGDIILNATENISIFGDFTEIVSSLEAASFGAGGNVIINTGNLSITDGAFLDVSTFGFGDAGNITINATDTVTLDDSVIQSSVSLFSVGDLVFDAIGNSGEITINTGNLFVTTGAQLLTQTEGIGNAGNITINATDQVLFEGFDSAGFPSLAFSTVKPGATGNSGNISITARSVEVKDGGTLTASVVANPPQIPPAGPSNAGSIEINARENVLFAGGGASSFLGENTQGQGGSINIMTGNLSVIDGASLSVSTAGIGEAGSINVSASNRVLFSGGVVGENFNPIPSGALSTVESTGQGNSGSITITTGSLNVLNGASLETQVLGGDAERFVEAGEIRIDAIGDVTFDGVGSVDSFENVGDETRIAEENTGSFSRSQAATTIASGVAGNSGDIIINAENLSVTNGAQLQASNSGTGTAGDINITVRNNATFDGSSFDEVSDVFELEDSRSQAATTIGFLGGGMGGDVNISAINLSVTNGAQLEASIEPFAIGIAGNILVNTRDNIFFDGVSLSENGVVFPSKAATILSVGAVGTGGDINLKTTNLSVTHGAQLDVRTFGLLGTAGNVIVEASDSIFFDGFFDADNISGAFTTVEGIAGNELTGIGLGGDITLIADNISLSNFARLKTAAIGFGNAGNIFVTTENLLATDNAEIQAQVDGLGAAGNVGITARNSIYIDNSRVFTTVDGESFGEGGGIEINTGNLFVYNGGQLQAQVNESAIGNAGKVLINASDSVFFDGVNLSGFASQAFTSVGAGALGIGGDITINTQNLSVTNGASLSASIFNSGLGDAGTVTINATERVYFDGGSGAESGTGIDAVGSGGQININTKNISFTNGVELFTGTFGRGEPENPTVAGNIIIQATEDVYFDDSRVFSTVEEGATNAKGGTIYVSAENLLVTNGGQLQALTRGQGNAGSVILEVRDSVTFEGFNIEGFFSAALSSVEQRGVGTGGDVVVRTDNLSIYDGARLSAENIVDNSTNKAGNVWVDANTINMENNANILTRTASGDGGDIGINSRDLIMRNGSQIRTDAGIGGDGGNITIDTELLVGLRRSHITANAFNGRGGEININADGRFGFEFYSRERLERLFGTENLAEFDPTLLPNSSITSISLTDPSLSGDVEINDFDPTRGLIELPRVVVDPNDLINQDPCKQGQESELYIRGRGGIQVTPDDKLDDGEIEVDLVEPVPVQPQNRRNSSPNQSRTETEENQVISSLDIVLARGWIRDQNGDVILVDYDPTQTGVQRPQPHPHNPNICQPVSENPE